MKYIALILLFNLSFAGLFSTKPIACSTEIAPRSVSLRDRQICIVEIKRSAKNFWEYQAVVSIDGEIRPQEKYNCRDRFLIEKDGTVKSFDNNDVAGNLVCSLYKR